MTSQSEHQSEYRYLQDLIKTFPCDEVQIGPQSAYTTIHSRYEQIEKRFKSEPGILTGFDVEFPLLFNKFARFVHEYLFHDILSNAGEFRNKTDPEFGQVYFGPLDSRKPHGLAFKGTSPDLITAELAEAFLFLTRENSDPIKSALRFYQKFVYIHPFYDANGRIGRLIVYIFLDYHGYFVDWKKLEDKNNKNKFIKKLNKCHKREEKKTKSKYYKYFKYLFNYFRKFVHSKEEIPDKLSSDEE